jgi:hypothetical protein
VQKTEHEILAILLVLRGGSDAENYYFSQLEEVRMQSTHESLFGKFRDCITRSTHSFNYQSDIQ